MLEKLKTEILESVTPEGVPVKFVTVDGHGGSGKTTLAKLLAEELDAGVIHTDDFASYDNTMDWWPQMIENVFEPIYSGAKTLNYERGRWYKDHVQEPIKDQPVKPIMIIEGVSSSRQEFRKYLAYSIWVETPKDICFERALARDGQDKLAQWEEWHRYELEYVERDNPRAYVNTIIDGTKDYN